MRTSGGGVTAAGGATVLYCTVLYCTVLHCRWSYTSWAQGQPDNHFSLLGSEDYVGINFGQRGKWNDWVDGGHISWVRPIRGFICQYPK